MTSDDLKAEILGWLRFMRKQEIVCTEVGHWNADCWGLSPTRLIEVETKVTIQDFKADFRKQKHEAYAAGTRSTPNLFFFAIPEDLVEEAEQALDVASVTTPTVPKYGLLACKGYGYLGRQTRVVRKAQKLHDRPPSDSIQRVARLRMGSELCGLHQTLWSVRNHFEQVFSDGIRRLRDDANAMGAAWVAAHDEEINWRLKQGLPPIAEDDDGSL